MTAQIINLIKGAPKPQVHFEHWSEEYEPEDRENLQWDFISDLTGQTEVCECKTCYTRDDSWTFEEGCPSCGEIEHLTYLDESTAEDLIRKWPVSWGWVFGADLKTPIGCVGNMPWGHFNTVHNTLNYHDGTNHVTVDLPSTKDTVVDLHAFGMKVFEKAQAQNA